MDLKEVYLGLGGNIGDTYTTLQSALKKISAIKGIVNLEVSNFYETTPVGGPPQNHYLNAVCRFSTSLPINQLFQELQVIEMQLGKKPKPKNEARTIDIDLLFYGLERHNTMELQVPHPRWVERLFVLIPLSDLVTDLIIPTTSLEGIQIFNLPKFIDNFENINHEVISLYKAKLAI